MQKGRFRTGVEAPWTLLSGYQTLEPLREGPHTLVVRARRESDGAAVVLKTVRTATPSLEQFSRFSHEHEVLKKLDGQGGPRPYELQISPESPRAGPGRRR